jgi:hypothetical protein
MACRRPAPASTAIASDDQHRPQKGGFEMPTTKSIPTLSDKEDRALRQLLRCKTDRLYSDEPFDAESQPAQQDHHRAVLSIGRLQLSIDRVGLIELDCDQLHATTLIALLNDPGVPRSAKREISLLFDLRGAHGVFVRGSQEDAGAGESGATNDT